MNPGEWYELLDGQVVRVVEVSGEPPMVLAETPGGGAIERPATYAQVRWNRLPPDGLRVRLATEPGAVRRLSEEDPMEVVVLSLRDAGGEATTTQIRESIALFLDEESAAAWWKRNQPKLNRDARIDDSAALSKRYRLLGPGRTKLERRREHRTGILRGELELLDNPTLKRNRERAKTVRRSEEETDELLRFAELVDDASIDATDRFLAGEIGVLVARWSEEELANRLGLAVGQLDLLRITDHESRGRSLQLFERYVDQRGAPLAQEEPAPIPGIPPTVASAVALGDRWGERALAMAGRLGLSPREMIVAGITWAVPGSEAAGDVDPSKDFQAYLRRISRLSASLQMVDPTGLDEQTSQLLGAMDAMSTLTRKGDAWRNCLVALAEVIWDVRPADHDTVQFAIGRSLVNKGAVWDALVTAAPTERLQRLETHLERAYAATPGMLPALKICARRRDRDLTAWLVQIARQQIRDTDLARILRDALEQGSEPSVARSESVTLGGTTWPDHSLISEAVLQMEQEVRKSLLTGELVTQGPVLVRATAWPRLVADIQAVVSAAESERDGAVSARRELEATIEELQGRLEERRSALQEARTQQTEQGAASTQRLAANLFKSVAAAVDDSYEAGSLGSLQDQVLAAMARLRIRPIVTTGEVTTFDPDHHAWTGEGYPPPRVKAITPGFVAELEGGGELVLAFARVGPPTEDPR